MKDWTNLSWRTNSNRRSNPKDCKNCISSLCWNNKHSNSMRTLISASGTNVRKKSWGRRCNYRNKSTAFGRTSGPNRKEERSIGRKWRGSTIRRWVWTSLDWRNKYKEGRPAKKTIIGIRWLSSKDTKCWRKRKTKQKWSILFPSSPMKNCKGKTSPI